MPTNVLEQIDQELGDQILIEPTVLIKIGLFGSQSALLETIRQRRLPSIRISSHRIVVPRDAILDFVRANFRDALKPSETPIPAPNKQEKYDQLEFGFTTSSQNKETRPNV